MKRFKILVSLLLLFGFVGFSTASYDLYFLNESDPSVINPDWDVVLELPRGSSSASVISYPNTISCFTLVSPGGASCTINSSYLIIDASFYCYVNTGTTDFSLSFSCNSQYSNGRLLKSYVGEIPSTYDSLQCQTEYDLIPISSVDSEYCTSNGLCPSSSCSGSVITGNNWSALFINDIQHPSAGVIDISIPEEFEWNYTGNDELFELDVVGYNTDPDYIAGIITTQKTTPNNQDFNNIVSGLIPLLIPGLVIILFIFFVFRFLKKIF